MVYLVKNGSYLANLLFIKIGLAAISMWAFATFLSPFEYGIYSYLFSMLTLLSLFTLTGMNNSILIASANNSTIKTLSSLLLVRIKFGTLGSLAALAVSAYYYLQGNLTLTIGMLLVATIIPVFAPFNNYTSILTGRKKFKSKLFFESGELIFYTIAILLSVFFISKALYIFLSVTLVSIIYRAFAYSRVINKYNQKKSKLLKTIQFERAKKLAKKGKQLSLINLIPNIANHIDKIIIFALLGATELSIYAFATMPVEQLKNFFRIIPSLAKPKLANISHTSHKKTLSYQILLITILSVGTIVLYIFLSPLLFKFLFPTYLDSLFYSQVFSLSLIAVPALYIMTLLETKGKNKDIFEFNIFRGILSITAIAGLTFLYGLWGTILARIITRLFTLIFSVYISQKDNTVISEIT